MGVARRLAGVLTLAVLGLGAYGAGQWQQAQTVGEDLAELRDRVQDLQDRQLRLTSGGVGRGELAGLSELVGRLDRELADLADQVRDNLATVNDTDEDQRTLSSRLDEVTDRLDTLAARLTDLHDEVDAVRACLDAGLTVSDRIARCREDGDRRGN